jgi:hypothetical protein
MTNHELNLAIARMMPGWTERPDGPYCERERVYPNWYEDNCPVRLFREPKSSGKDWSPATDLNDAAEAVRAICEGGDDEGSRWCVRQKWVNAMSVAQGGLTFYLVATAAPRAWCEALLAMENK